MDVVVWLRGLGLGKYEAVFRENDIDETILPNLTAEDLKELGVASLGHRRKLLDAIAALRTDTGLTGPSGAAGATSVAPSAAPEDRAQRRQVTVMFADLVGSTALSARMDPEDLREVISAYQKCVADTVQRFGGFVAKYLGDGVLVYFGYPQAQEDDAERAVRAGLELVAALDALKTHAPLQTRAGIATGPVSLARRRTLPHVCRALQSRTASGLPKAPASSLAICSSLRTSAPGTLRASQGQSEPGRRCDRL